MRSFALSVLLGFSFALSPNLFAQDDSAADLTQLQQQWKELDTKFEAQRADLNSGEGDITKKQAAYRELISQANKLIEKIETAAKAQLKEKPNDAEAIRTLMGILVNEAASGNDSEALLLGDELIAMGINSKYFEIGGKTERLSTPAREILDELVIRHKEAIDNNLPRIKFETTKGDIVIELFENEAPNTVGNFVSLVENEYYTDRLFHRIVEGFMAQGGGYKLVDGKEVGGQEGPGYSIKCECDTLDKRQHFSGSLSMAHAGKDTGGSQFFLTFERTDFLDGRHTCFGRVVEGHDVLDALTRTHLSSELSPTRQEQPIDGVVKDKIIRAEVLRKRNHVYKPDKVGGNEVAPELSAPQTEDAAEDKTEAEKSEEDK